MPITASNSKTSEKTIASQTLIKPAATQRIDVDLKLFHVAIEKGDCTYIADVAKKIPALLNSTNAEGMTSVHIASQSKQFKAFEVLQSCGANISTIDSYGFNVSHFAAYTESVEILEHFYIFGGDINAQDHNYLAPADYAVIMNHLSIIDSLIGNGVDFTTEKSLNRERLQLAVTNVYEADQQIMLNLNKFLERNNSTSDKILISPYQIAEIVNNSDAIKLIKQSVEIRQRTAEKNLALLHTAVKKGDCNYIATVARKNPTLLNAPDAHGKTAIHIAAQHNQLAAFKELQLKGANIHALDKGKCNAAIYAVISRSTGILEEFYKYCPDSNAVNTDGAAHLAAIMNDINVIKSLIKCKVAFAQPSLIAVADLMSGFNAYHGNNKAMLLRVAGFIKDNKKDGKDTVLISPYQIAKIVNNPAAIKEMESHVKKQDDKSVKPSKPLIKRVDKENIAPQTHLNPLKPTEKKSGLASSQGVFGQTIKSTPVKTQTTEHRPRTPLGGLSISST